MQDLQYGFAAKFDTRHNESRSAPPFRLIPGMIDTPYDTAKSIHEDVNDQAAIMIQIESLKGINNPDSILTLVPDVDAVRLGTVDARASMSLPGNGGMGGSEPVWLEAVAKYNSTLKKHNNPAAGFAVGPASAQMAEKKSILVVSAYVMALGALAQGLQEAKSAISAKSSNLSEGPNGGEHRTSAKTELTEATVTYGHLPTRPADGVIP